MNQNACSGFTLHPPTHTQHAGKGAAAWQAVCPSGSISFLQAVSYPIPQGEEEDDRLDGIEQSTHVSFIGREYMNILKLVGNKIR